MGQDSAAAAPKRYGYTPICSVWCAAVAAFAYLQVARS